VHEDDSVTFDPPMSRPNDCVDLRAELDCTIAFSACPQNIVPISGADRKPTGFDSVVLEP
jgi:uncharacterized protein YcgI (DUF1989 family)